MNILYAGDSEVGGAANYLLGVLRAMGARARHVPPTKSLTLSILENRYDAIVLSDFPHSRASAGAQQAIVRQVARGAGLIMIGGWASFSGPLGGWRGSVIERHLPVRCLARDDRVNFPSGAAVAVKSRHALLGSLSFEEPPVLCGLNALSPKRGSRVLLAARRIRWRAGRARLDGQEYPLLVVGENGQSRVAALATDVAPHWCGSFVDWGEKRLLLPVRDGIRVEVGDFYVRFFSSLVRWLAGRRP